MIRSDEIRARGIIFEKDEVSGSWRAIKGNRVSNVLGRDLQTALDRCIRDEDVSWFDMPKGVE